MPDGEPKRKAIHPPQYVDNIGVVGSNQDIIDCIPEQEFEVTGPTASAVKSENAKLGSELGSSANVSKIRTASPLRGGEVTAKFMAFADATSTRLKDLIQGSKRASEVADDAKSDSYRPESESLTPPQQFAVAVDPWTLPESKLTQRERKIKKEFLGKSDPKSKAMRPTKTREGIYSKPKTVDKVEQWICAHQLKLVTSGLTIFLMFFAWQLGHSFVAQELVNKGREQLSTGHPDDALTSFNQAILVDGQSASAYFRRGNLYRKKGELTKAFDDYSTSLKLSPSPEKAAVLDRRAIVSLQLENYQQAAYDYTVLFGLTPRHIQPQLYDNRAAAYFGLGQYDKALQDYNAALKVDPKWTKALTGSALCLIHLDRYAEAVASYNLVLELDPHDNDSYLKRGYCYQKQRHFTEAAKDFQTVLTQSPGNNEALCDRADLYADQGLWSEAFADLAAVLQLEPNYGRALMLRADLYSKKGNYANAVKDYDQAQAIPLFKGSLVLSLNRASVYEKMKEYAKAAADYSTAIGLAPKDYRLYISRAGCYQQMKDYKRAIADCTTAAELSPKTAAIYQLRGTLHEQFGNPISACKDYTTAISLDEKNLDSYVSRARFSLAKQDFAAALADFDQALKIDPKNAAAQAGRDQTVAATTAPKQQAFESVSVSPTPETNNLDLSKLSTAALIKNGYNCLQQGSADQAISMLSEAVRRNRNDSISRRYLGHALLRARRPSEAIGQFEALRKLTALLPPDRLAMQQAVQLDKTMRAEQATRSEPSTQSEQAFTRSGENKADTLIAKYCAALVSNPKDLDAKYNLAVAYSTSGKTEDALHECLTGMNESTGEDQQRFYRLYASLAPSSPNATSPNAKPVQKQ